MSSERLWILVLAAVSFLAGAAGGILYAVQLDPPRSSGPFAAYEEAFAEVFDLDRRRARDLHAVLDRYHGDLEELKARAVRDLEPELVQLGHTCRERIRKYVLAPDELDEFDRLCGGLVPLSSEPVGSL